MAQRFYDSEDGEFVDFETLDDWRARDVRKDAEIERLRAVLSEIVEHSWQDTPAVDRLVTMRSRAEAVLGLRSDNTEQEGRR